MMWTILLLILLVALFIPILAIVLDSPALRKLVESRYGEVDFKEITSRIMALEDEVEDLQRSVESLKEEARFVNRLLANPEKDQPEEPHQGSEE